MRNKERFANKSIVHIDIFNRIYLLTELKLLLKKLIILINSGMSFCIIYVMNSHLFPLDLLKMYLPHE